MANGHGGARPNSGPAKGTKYAPTISKEAAREVVRQLVMERLPAIVLAHLDNAEGIKYLVTRDKKTGKFIRVGAAMAGNLSEETVEVWEKDPNIQSATDLLNRALDRPKEQAQDINLTVELVAVSDRLLNARKRLALKAKNP